MKNILLITDGFPYGDCERGFITTEFYEMIKNFNVTLLVTYRGQTLDSSIPEQIKVIKYTNPDEKYKSSPRKVLRTLKALGELRHPEVRKDSRIAPKELKSFNLTRKICLYSNAASELEDTVEAAIAENNIDIVYSYWCIPATIASIRAKKKFPGLKVITRFHGFDLYKEQCPYGYQVLRHYVIANCEKLIFVCKYGKEYFNSQWGGEEKSMISYLGTRKMPFLGISGGKKLKLVSLSNLCSGKRVHLIIEGLALLPSIVEVSWIHIGDGELRFKLERQAHNLLDSRPNITWKFWGKCRNSEIEGIYEQIRPDVFITTTAHEGGAPVTIQEVFGMGIPAIGTRTGGVPDLILEGSTGILMSQNPESQEVADAIYKYYKCSIDEKKLMSQNCLKLWNSTFSAKKNAESMMELLGSL